MEYDNVIKYLIDDLVLTVTIDINIDNISNIISEMYTTLYFMNYAVVTKLDSSSIQKYYTLLCSKLISVLQTEYKQGDIQIITKLESVANNITSSVTPIIYDYTPSNEDILKSVLYYTLNCISSLNDSFTRNNLQEITDLVTIRDKKHITNLISGIKKAIKIKKI